MSVSVVDIHTKQLQDIDLGVGYIWSPNKQLVAAYHHSYKYGVSMGNVTSLSKGDAPILTIRRKHTDSYNDSDLVDQTTIAWSDDSQKLAIVIKKEYKEQLELLVYDVTQPEAPMYRRDLTHTQIKDLTWQNDQVVVMGDG